jgi:uncharacterized membrane protein
MAELEFLINIGFMLLQIYGVLSLLAFVPAMIDILKSRKSTKYKLVWLAICLILGVIGALIYFMIEKKMLRFRR